MVGLGLSPNVPNSLPERQVREPCLLTATWPPATVTSVNDGDRLAVARADLRQREETPLVAMHEPPGAARSLAEATAETSFRQPQPSTRCGRVRRPKHLPDLIGAMPGYAARQGTA